MSLLTCAQLVDSLTDCYPQTRAWSQPAFLQRTDAQAIGYGSRRNVSGRRPKLPAWLRRVPSKPLAAGLLPAALAVLGVGNAQALRHTGAGSAGWLAGAGASRAVA